MESYDNGHMIERACRPNIIKCKVLIYFFIFVAIVVETSIRLFTAVLQPRVKPIFYYSSLVLIFSIVIGRFVILILPISFHYSLSLSPLSLSLLSLFSFVVFMPVSYGMSGPKSDSPDSQMYGLKWLPTWDI